MFKKACPISSGFKRILPYIIQYCTASVTPITSSKSGKDNTNFVQLGNLGRTGFPRIFYEKGKNNH
jgi:hypothetical protein